ncbi:MAG: hypothetical protein HY854_05320 [Burkholderiales bacterium]|nr:hypothetical protein [Burkholderiales bacterium]
MQYGDTSVRGGWQYSLEHLEAALLTHYWDWIRRELLGEPPRSACFDLQVNDRVGARARRTGSSIRAPEPLQSAGIPDVHQLPAREPVPQEFLARQTPAHRRRVVEVMAYRDHLQAVLDIDWSKLTRAEMLEQALKGYRWLDLLETTMAQDPDRFVPSLDSARDALGTALQHGMQATPNASPPTATSSQS